MTGNTRFAVSVHILAYLSYRRAEAVSSAEIATSVATNPVVIRRLLSTLVKAGLVASTKGVQGGFALAAPPATISLRDIYRAVEPSPKHGVALIAPNRKCPVGAKIQSLLQTACQHAQSSMEAELARTSLARIDKQLRHTCAGRG